jgi:single-strand DNA-binding protein
MGQRSSSRAPSGSVDGAQTPDGVNEVHLIGRVAAAAECRQLPSGDEVSLLRIVVPRAAPSRRAAGSRSSRAPIVDTLDCAVWTAALRRKVHGLDAGTIVEISGSLRRRFWRAPGGAASRYEVEVQSLRRVPGRPGAPPTAR